MALTCTLNCVQTAEERSLPWWLLASYWAVEKENRGWHGSGFSRPVPILGKKREVHLVPLRMNVCSPCPFRRKNHADFLLISKNVSWFPLLSALIDFSFPSRLNPGINKRLAPISREYHRTCRNPVKEIQGISILAQYFSAFRHCQIICCYNMNIADLHIHII